MSQTNQRKALGKGLEQLFNNNNSNVEAFDFSAFEKEIVTTTPESDIKMIPISEIRSNPYQPRIHFDENALQELASSIKEHGVFEPIIVKKSIKGYELVAGERRTRASKLAGLDTIPAIVKDFNDTQMMEIAILENIQREDLSPIEEARAYKNYMIKCNMTQEVVANRFGKSRSYITNLLGLLNLPSEVQKLVNNGDISMSHARVLSKIEDPNVIVALANRVLKESLSVREIENITSGEEVVKKNPLKKNDIPKSTRYKVYETSLREAVGTKVNISSNKITIPFDSEADLDRIMEILNIEIGD